MAVAVAVGPGVPPVGVGIGVAVAIGARRQRLLVGGDGRVHVDGLAAEEDGEDGRQEVEGRRDRHARAGVRLRDGVTGDERAGHVLAPRGDVVAGPMTTKEPRDSLIVAQPILLVA